MSIKRRRFRDEFKDKVLREVSSGKSIAEVTRQHGLSKNSVYEWQAAAAAQTSTVPVPQRELADLHDKIAELERLVGRLSLENDILKKLAKRQEMKGDEIN